MLEKATTTEISKVKVYGSNYAENQLFKSKHFTDVVRKYDSLHQLNIYSNFMLHEYVASSEHKDRILIGSHTLECEGGVREGRYGSPHTHHKYDALHLRGTSGKISYTRSVLNIFQNAGLVTGPIEVTVPSMKSQWQGANPLHNQPQGNWHRVPARRNQVRRLGYAYIPEKNRRGWRAGFSVGLTFNGFSNLFVT